MDAKELVLSANIEYKNSSDRDFDDIIQRVTIPVETSYQKLKKIEVENIKDYKIKHFKKGVESYMEFRVNSPKHSTTTREVKFIIDLEPKDVKLKDRFVTKIDKDLKEYLKPTRRIQIYSKPIQKISKKIASKNRTQLQKINAIFSYPANNIKYRPQSTTSALKAIQSGIGDCTEYSLVFVALARSMGIPARQASVFNFSKRDHFKMPNHHIAEIYTDRYGWIPIYPNLSRGKNQGKYAIGNISKNLLMYKYQNWTWSRRFTKGVPRSLREQVKTKVTWSIK
jgi:transglutaminase-like putative cysteine protease